MILREERTAGTKGKQSRNNGSRDSLGGPVAKTPSSQCKGAGVPSLVRELDPACHN